MNVPTKRMAREDGIVTNQNKTAYHDGKEDKPFEITMFHKAAHTTTKLEPAKMLPRRTVTNHTALGKTVVYFNNISFWTWILLTV